MNRFGQALGFSHNGRRGVIPEPNPSHRENDGLQPPKAFIVQFTPPLPESGVTSTRIEEARNFVEMKRAEAPAKNVAQRVQGRVGKCISHIERREVDSQLRSPDAPVPELVPTRRIKAFRFPIPQPEV